MNRDEQPGLRVESRLQNDERGTRSDEKSPMRVLDFGPRTPDSGLRFQSLELHIEELMLHGFAPGDRYHISEAVERELARLFIEQGVPPSLMNGGDVIRLDAGTFELTPRSKAEAIGAQVAQVVYQGLTL